MRILHCCLSCFYVDNYNYQENILPIIHDRSGHEVKILASTETFLDNNQIGYGIAKTYMSREGIEIIRVPYRAYFPHFIMKKIRHYKGVRKTIEDFKPDIILFHGVSALELSTFGNYKKKNPQVKLYVDSHQDENNSGRNQISKLLLHGIFYKTILKRNIKYIEKIFYITPECKDYLIENYNVPNKLLEYYPLGGRILDPLEKQQYRKEIRAELSLSNEDILLCHSGKMEEKKRTYELIQNFSKVKYPSLKLIIIGTFGPNVKSKVMPLIALDKRIQYLGWKKAEELMKYIGASDLYVQPGSQSATMQNALCVGTPVLLRRVKSHRIYIGKAFFIREFKEMEAIFQTISENPEILNSMSEKAYEFAKENLDYEKLARRILQ